MAERKHERKRLRRGHQLAPVAVHIVLENEALDHGGAGSRRAQTLYAHRRAQFLVLDQFARALHGREQRRLGETRRRPGLIRLDFDLRRFHYFAIGDRDHQRVFRSAAIDREPARLHHYPALAAERLALDAGNTRGDEKLGCREEHREEAFHHHVIEFGLGIG